MTTCRRSRGFCAGTARNPLTAGHWLICCERLDHPGGQLPGGSAGSWRCARFYALGMRARPSPRPKLPAG